VKFLCILAICLGFAINGRAQEPAGTLDVQFFNVGQGDAIFVRCPDGEHTLLIDGGELNQRYPKSATQFKELLGKAFQGQPKALTVIINSHPHSDHIGSLKWVIENFTVGTYVDNGDHSETATFGRLQELLEDKAAAGELVYQRFEARVMDPIPFCPHVSLEVIAPAVKEPSLDNPNDRSLIVRLSYKTTSFLFVGDAEKEAEHVLLSDAGTRAKLDSDVLKVAHHGSHSSSTADFIGAVSPQTVVISCGVKAVGSNAGHRHPRLVTMNSFDTWFKNLSAADHPPLNEVWAFDHSGGWQSHTRRKGVWVTPKDGTVTITSDGAAFTTTLELNSP
jgi:competence protein ComEC